MNGVVKNIQALSIQTTGQLIVLTKGQKGLLTAIRHCVENNIVLDWDLIVKVYSDNVRSEYHNFTYVKYGSDTQPRTYVVLDEYNNQTSQWTYVIRGLVKSWLLSNIGILVLKNQLIVIPVIQID